VYFLKISDLCKKMSNPAFMSVCFEGKRRELRSLYGKMKRLEVRQKPLVENSFYNPKCWLGNLVTRLGADWREVYCRGTWDSLQLKKNHLYFFTETAWKPPFALLKLIQKCYPSFVFYFFAEGDDWDTYLTNDAECKYFSSRYVIDMEPGIEYFLSPTNISRRRRPLFDSNRILYLALYACILLPNSIKMRI
jgi:hypothetical protein